MDPELRNLARRADDPEAREALERSWLRSGLGWRGQELPPGVVADQQERGVYRFHRGEFVIDLVEALVPPVHVFIGRFPVTWGQYTVFCDETGRRRPAQPPFLAPGIDESDWRLQPFHPVVNVTWHDAAEFCEWAGLALPTETEWRAAVFGHPSTWPRCRSCLGTGDAAPRRAPAVARVCATCSGLGNARPRYPWGEEDPVLCGPLAWFGAGRTAPVILADPATVSASEFSRWTPARPGGASPCGMQDALGNVRIYLDDGSCIGASFKDCIPTTPPAILDRVVRVNLRAELALTGRFDADCPNSHTGFRVAMRPPE